MQHFRYQAVDREGRMHRGRLAASAPDEVAQRLLAQGLELLSLRRDYLRLPGGGPRIPRAELINFCFQLEQLCRAGVPLLDGLADLRDSLDHAAFRTLIQRVVADIAGGLALSQALAAHPRVFNPVFTHLIEAGERSGRLPEILAELTDNLRWEDELVAHARSVLIYPAFVSAVVVGASLFLALFLLPKFEQFVRALGQDLPWITRQLLHGGRLLAEYGLPLLGLGTLLLLLASLRWPTRPALRHLIDRVQLRLPLIGPVLGKIILARFSSTFALLYGAGIPVLEAVRSTQGIVGNALIRQGLAQVEQAVASGHHLTGAFRDTGLFPPLVIRMLHIGEQTGALDTALRNVGYFYHRDVRESVRRLQSLIEPLLTLLLGALLGGLLLSLFGPIYDVVSRIRP